MDITRNVCVREGEISPSSLSGNHQNPYLITKTKLSNSMPNLSLPTLTNLKTEERNIRQQQKNDSTSVPWCVTTNTVQGTTGDLNKAITYSQPHKCYVQNVLETSQCGSCKNESSQKDICISGRLEIRVIPAVAGNVQI